MSWPRASPRAGSTSNLPKSYGTGNYQADQKIALRQLISYLKLAEKGQMRALLDALEDDDTRGDMIEFSKPHPNAVLLEAVILLTDIASSTGASIAGFGEEMLKRFETRRIVNVAGGNGPVWVPPKN